MLAICFAIDAAFLYNALLRLLWQSGAASLPPLTLPDDDARLSPPAVFATFAAAPLIAIFAMITPLIFAAHLLMPVPHYVAVERVRHVTTRTRRRIDA